MFLEVSLCLSRLYNRSSEWCQIWYNEHMPQVSKKGLGIVVELAVSEKLWSLHGDFHLNPKNISSLSKERPTDSWKELRIPGTYIPKLIKAGTYLTTRGKEFWYVTKAKSNVLVIELSNMPYKRLVLGFKSKHTRDTTWTKVENSLG